MTTSVINAHGLGKSYRRYPRESMRILAWLGIRVRGVEEHWAVRSIDLTVRRGEALGILGRNGAGKSTLLKLICGVLKPSEGSVELTGRAAALLELGTGFNPELTCRSNVVVSAELAGVSSQEIYARMVEIEAFADVGEYFDRPLRECSSGMQMRVGFAVATAFEPDVLIVDEALAVGDASFQAKCFERIAQFRARGGTLLLVSHAVEAITKHCDRAILLDRGMLAMEGNPREVSNAYMARLFPGRGNSDVQQSAAVNDMLDTDAADRYHLNPLYRKDEKRWGSADATIIDFAVSTEHGHFPLAIATGQEIRVLMKVRFLRAVGRPVFGLLLKTHDGVFLHGTNSNLCGRSEVSGAARPGEVRIGEFRFRAALNSGSYLLSLGVSDESDGGEMRPLDRRYDSILISVQHEAPFWGIVDLYPTFSLVAGGTG